MPEHQPYVPATQSPAELTPRALLLGVLLGLIFSASSVYLALKIGLTVSSSIPIAVLSITIFRALARTSNLENKIVQTTGSASYSVPAGRSGQGAGLLPRGRRLHGGIPRADGGRLHHRAAHRGLPVRGRLPGLPGARSGDQARGIRPHRAVRVPGGQADPRYESGRDPRQFRVLYRGRRRRLGWNHRARPLAPHDPELLRLEPQGSARLPAGAGGDAAADRSRPADLPHRGRVT